ncbi:sugar ABC transporter permease [Paenibacillus marchantiophytorum]|uniref:Sugar ABC transporter permease n=1 Tax=Paenibacillus marchantiophytorum TaxID=1619310 RepID=A0ABQ2BSG4_9BACL|nr:carbohydrate ABC transporter permease [Paenibacillus marchantiophytorum]GGI46551.1 sugar ABC transporter permease [Paenibacillus marchantiophytorum]
MSPTITIKSFALHFLLIVGGLLSLFPFYWMSVIATNKSSDVFRFPPKLVFGSNFLLNVQHVFANINFGTSFLNTIGVSTCAMVLVLFFSSMAGFFFAKYRFPGSIVLFNILLISLMIPSQLSLIPSFIIISNFGWISTFKALILPGLVPATAFGVFWIRQYAKDTIHDELLDAGRIDGCHDFRLYWHVGFPLLRPALAFLGLFSFISTWNDYLWPLVVMNNPKKYTLQISLSQLNSIYSTDYSLVMAGTLLATIPLIVIFLVFSKQFIANIAAGAVKA